MRYVVQYDAPHGGRQLLTPVLQSVQYRASVGMEDANAVALGALIGERVRTERLRRSWTLDQLAGRSGVSRRMLINIEQGSANPSIATLLRLSDALGVGLPTLVRPPADSPIRVLRHGERAPLWTSPSGGRAVLAAGTEAPDVVELWDWTLAAGDSHHSEPHGRGTRELLLVLEGCVTLDVSQHQVDLGVGDTASFYADVPHGYSNNHADATVARFTLTVFQPNVGVGVPHATSRRDSTA
jgi:transcriptional regulator with XRE-family HTH domain